MSFELIPDDKLVEILEFVQEPLYMYCATLVCRKWREIIHLYFRAKRFNAVRIYTSIKAEDLISVNGVEGYFVVDSIPYSYPVDQPVLIMIAMAIKIMRQYKDNIRMKGPKYTPLELGLLRAVFCAGRAERVIIKGNIYTLTMKAADRCVKYLTELEKMPDWLKITKIPSEENTGEINIMFADFMLSDGSCVLKLM